MIPLLLPQISRGYGVGVDLPNLSKGKTRPVPPPLVRGGHGARRECAGQPDQFINSPIISANFTG